MITRTRQESGMTASGLSRFRLAFIVLCASTSVVAAPVASAQKKGDKNSGPVCAVDNDNGAEALSGRLFLARATDPKTSVEDRSKTLRQAVGTLGGNYDRNKDIGRDYLLGEALVLFAAEPATPLVGPRSTYGFKDNPAGTIDVLATADTILTLLETTHPECASQASAVRQQAYVPLVNASIGALNAGLMDSANATAQRALLIYKKSPYVYNVLAGVAVKKADYATAQQDYRQVIAVAGNDTLYKKLKVGAMYNLAVVTTSLADADTGSSKKAKSDSAVQLWKDYVAANPGDPNGQAGLTNALQSSGDTAAAGQLYTDMLANPQKYTDIQMFQSAVAAARANRQSDALKLFEAGLVKNPFYNQALVYVSNEYFNAGQLDKLFPAVRRLVDVDPADSDNYRLLAGAYQIRAKAEAGAAQKADRDSLVAALTKWKHPTSQVSVSRVLHDGDKMQISGKIQNLTTASKTYNIKFQFLDVTGKVLGSQDVPPLTVAGGASQPFDVSATVPGVIAYKYLPVE
jgi:tetratricopeptide (TPR) repeat protein